MTALAVFLNPITFFINLFLGLLVFRANPKKDVNRVFAFLAICVAFWALFLLFYEYPLVFSSLFWLKIVYIVVFGIVYATFYLSYIFPVTTRPPSKILVLLYFGLAIFFSYMILFTDLHIRNVVRTSTGIQTIVGSLYILYPLFLLFFCGIGFFNYAQKFRRSRGLVKAQLLYLLMGLMIFSFLAAILDGIIPFLTGRSDFFTISPVTAVFFTGFTTYAIVKHRLMDIRLVVARTISYTLLSLIIVSFYTLSLFIIGHWIFPSQLNGNQLVVSVLLALVVAYTFQPLKQFVEGLTENIFFQGNYNPEELLGRISRILGTTLDIKKLANNVLQELLDTMHLDFGALFVLGNQSQNRIVIQGKNGHKRIELTSRQVKFLISSHRHLAIFDELKEGRLKKFMRQANLGVLVKLSVKEKVVGMLFLGNRLSGDIYMDKDVKVLEILAPQLAVAIQNTQQYEEIKQFSEKLKAEVKKATSDLSIANRKLKELDAQKDEFISVAAHELRAPMTAIKGYISMVMEGDAGEIPDKVREFLDEATNGNDRLIRLVNNMLNVSRIEEGRLTYEMANVSLSEVVKLVFDDHKSQAEEKGLSYTLSIPENLKDIVYVDKDRIFEVISNFISNAIKYTDKGEVKVSILQPSADLIRFEVKDTGPGISEDDKKKLFQKFFRAQSDGGKVMGTGLGLYISKLLVEKFAGEIGVDSELGKGSTFWFELPLVN